LTIPGLSVVGKSGLDVAQAPNGNLIEVRYTSNTIWVSRPIETATTAVRVSSVFPTRGSVAGGTTLRIYGLNFGTSATVVVGGSSCSIVGPVQSNYIECTLPGKAEGRYDIVVTAVAGTYTFEKGYRYIKGY
jgi:IPT/TIG domain